ncbi:hypothetical protein PtA15_12A89 [Puccinia triticina]|uniref:Autophagy-related protein n=1 Tax=Puccinia triticina TaxID=208348 RepID=A0ABY7CXR4_9BASI|nr:uncharacterized protein PtA15_12A89 [Puccinia triticina]WAQ90104.1 hypothetical protein PtA15_12A89 [Puccinia triticina]WAR61391.1 hypothetical protein PtB15_12B76 [Puccinia triticina]
MAESDGSQSEAERHRRNTIGMALLLDQIHQHDSLSLTAQDKILPIISHTPLPAETIPSVSRVELWSYYLYGVGPMSYSLTLFQSLATSAGYDPDLGPGSPCTADRCIIPFGGNGQTKSVSSVVLIANGISFGIMTILFTSLGALADYRQYGRWILFIMTLLCWASQFSVMALTDSSRWKEGMVLYILGFVTYGATLVFYAAQFPIIASNTPKSRHLTDDLHTNKITEASFELEQSLERSRISNISTVHSNIGYLFVSVINLSVLLPLANNSRVNNYTIVLTNVYWIIVGIWWFVFQNPRPGPPLPRGQNPFTIGWHQLYAAFKNATQLPYTFTYLVAFFLLADGLNTTGTLISIIQSNTVNFSFLENTYLGIAQAVTSIISTLAFWYIQKHWKLKTKHMFVVTNLVTVLIPLWGTLGIWINVIGFHNRWEFWAYNIIFGMFQAPYYSYSQTIMAELSPPGHENMFFALFGFSNRASSIIGPNVIQVIIDRTGSNWSGFPFLFAICLLPSIIILLCVDLEKGRQDALKWKMKQS